MLAYHCDSNAILCLQTPTVPTPPERAIQTFKAHFLSILAGVDVSFPNYLWDKLLPQTELTLNLLRQATISPSLSAWEAFHGIFNYDATPLGPMGCPVIIHNKASTRKSWDFRGRDGFSIGPALLHYRCFQVVDSATKNLLISDTVEFRHNFLSQPKLSYEDRLLHAINFLSTAIADALPTLLTPNSPPSSPTQPICPLDRRPQHRATNPGATHTATTAPRHTPPSTPTNPPVVPPPTPPIPNPTITPPPPPRAVTQPPPRAVTHPPPVAHHTRSRNIPTRPDLGEAVAHRTRSKVALIVAAMYSTKPQACPSSTDSCANTQALAPSGTNPTQTNSDAYAKASGQTKKALESGSKEPTPSTLSTTKTSLLTDAKKSHTPRWSAKCNQRKPTPTEHASPLVATESATQETSAQKPTPLELVKLMINSILSRPNAQFCTFDIANFYLGTPLDRPEYVRIRLDDIPQEFIDEYNLTQHVRDGWVYFKIVRGVYGLPQSGILANQLLEKRLNAAGYYQLDATPGLWRHKWRPVMFTLIVDDFGVEYVGDQHAIHLRDTIKQHYDLTENWKGDLYAGINLVWNYEQRTCRLTMDEYIATVLLKYNHPIPKKRQLSPSKAAPLNFGAKTQFTPDEDTSDPLDADGIKRVQGIVGALLYYARAVDNKLLYTLSDIGSEQAAATTRTNQKVHQLLDYCATYPNDGITFRASKMILGAHADAAFLNASNSRSRAAATHHVLRR
eukprot:CCRYP_009139-RA/>CCRYP_009139-RA protein AED:0.22 eAED:0.22 QI:0/0/0/1/0/0/4/0/733